VQQLISPDPAERDAALAEQVAALNARDQD